MLGQAGREKPPLHTGAVSSPTPELRSNEACPAVTQVRFGEFSHQGMESAANSSNQHRAPPEVGLLRRRPHTRNPGLLRLHFSFHAQMRPAGPGPQNPVRFVSVHRSRDHGQYIIVTRPCLPAHLNYMDTFMRPTLSLHGTLREPSYYYSPTKHCQD